VVATNFSGSFSCAFVFIAKTVNPVKQIAIINRLNLSSQEVPREKARSRMKNQREPVYTTNAKLTRPTY
jgi:hypothetical protein